MNRVAMIFASALGGDSSRRAITHGFSDLENQPGLAPRPARKSKATVRISFKKPDVQSSRWALATSLRFNKKPGRSI